jgi:4-hydroxy-3-methylbut-2-en-1-yl diphosphate reductase
MKTFEVPEFYRSPIISNIKTLRKAADKQKKDFTPSKIVVGNVTILLARHFGFCYGVENAIEIAFKTVAENPGKRIYLLSEMIHNPQVNADLVKSGVQFIMDTDGNIITPWSSITSDDVVIIPAFGTTLHTEDLLKQKGIDPLQYNTTCPFVERVWNKGDQIAAKGYSIVIHGKPNHEETRATFSHSTHVAPSVVVKDMKDAELLAKYITRQLPSEQFYTDFKEKHSPQFNPELHLSKLGVINQTTMLAEDTKAIADYLKQILVHYYQLNEATLNNHFADTRDTLCYATMDNQTAVKGMLQHKADFALVVGGYNSSNTSHLVELCELQLPTYFIRDASHLIDDNSILHYHFEQHKESITHNYLPKNKPVTVMITSGASCPDAVVEQVIIRLLQLYNEALPQADAIELLQA